MRALHLEGHHCFSFDIMVITVLPGWWFKETMNAPTLKDRTHITEQTSVLQDQLLSTIFIAQSGLQTTWTEYFLKFVHLRDWPQAKANIGVFLLTSAAFGCNPLMHDTRGSSNNYKSQQKGLHWLSEDIGPFRHLHIDLPTSTAFRFSTPCGFFVVKCTLTLQCMRDSELTDVMLKNHEGAYYSKTPLRCLGHVT